MNERSTHRAEYHALERMWYLWNGHEAILGDDDKPRLFLTALAAYEWLSRRQPQSTIEPKE